MSRQPTSPPRSQQDLSSPPVQSIPMQNLSRPPGGEASGPDPDRLSPRAAAQLPSIQTYWGQPSQGGSNRHSDDISPGSPIDPAALQYALPPEIHPPGPGSRPGSSSPYAPPEPYYEEATQHDYFSDSAPLTSTAQPISGAGMARGAEAPGRNSFQTISDVDEPRSPLSPRTQDPRNTKMLGFDLGQDYANKHRSYGETLAPRDQRLSRAPGTALHRAGSIVRAMSQRVVNLSGEGDALEQQQRQSRSRSPSADGRRPSNLAYMSSDTGYQSQVYPPEKPNDPRFTFVNEPASFQEPRVPMANPLKGRSLGIFSPDNPIRVKLCDLLVNPYTEPLILMLIVLQAILLAVEASPNVFEPGNERPPRWGGSTIEWVMLGLFVIFTLELIARIIVSGFIWNPTEYSTVDRKKGFKAVVADKYNDVFGPQRQRSVNKGHREENFGPSTFTRSFTVMHGQRLPETVEEAQRMQLARRAFLRHGFNRLDFTAVVSFWITFGLSITGIEMEYHFFIFRMMSCLRIVRLLALTNGTAVSNIT
jgi:voltage-dependent calcium channel